MVTEELRTSVDVGVGRVVAVKRLVELDFVRGIAILLVMGFHFQARSTVPVPDSGVMRVLRDFGPHGVDLFFVLSGFLVGGLLLKEYDGNGRIQAARFIARRAWKIWPPYYFYLLVVALSGRHAALSFLGPNLLHLQNYLGTPLKHTWSLAVEEHFYLLLPVLLSVALSGREPFRRLAYVVVSIAAATIAVRCIQSYAIGTDSVFAMTHTRMDSLLFGVLLAGANVWRRDAFVTISSHWILLALVSVAPVLMVMYVGDPFLLATTGYTIIYLGCGAFILLVLGNSRRIRDWRIYRGIAAMGVYSYGIYLWHNAAQTPVEAAMEYFPQARGFWVLVACKIGVAIFLGVVTTRLVELPALRLREKFSPNAVSLKVVSRDSDTSEVAKDQVIVSEETLRPRD